MTVGGADGGETGFGFGFGFGLAAGGGVRVGAGFGAGAEDGSTGCGLVRLVGLVELAEGVRRGDGSRMAGFVGCGGLARR